MTQPPPPTPIDLSEHRRTRADLEREIAAGSLRGELQRLRRVRDGEARRLEARIAELERLLPELWKRGRRIDELSEELEAERTARSNAEETAEIFREEIELLHSSLAAERERSARLSGTGDPAAPADPYRVWEQRFRDRSAQREADEIRRLRDRIERQLTALQEKESRIASLVALLDELDPEPDDGPDDLTRISGVGPAIASILQQRGITSFEALAELTDDQLQKLGEVMPVYPRRVFDDRWTDQARELAEARASRRHRWEVPR